MAVCHCFVVVKLWVAVLPPPFVVITLADDLWYDVHFFFPFSLAAVIMKLDRILSIKGGILCHY